MLAAGAAMMGALLTARLREATGYPLVSSADAYPLAEGWSRRYVWRPGQIAAMQPTDAGRPVIRIYPGVYVPRSLPLDYAPLSLPLDYAPFSLLLDLFTAPGWSVLEGLTPGGWRVYP